MNEVTRQEIHAWVKEARGFFERCEAMDEAPGCFSASDWYELLDKENQITAEARELLCSLPAAPEACAIAEAMRDEEALQRVYDDNRGFVSAGDYLLLYEAKENSLRAAYEHLGSYAPPLS